MTAHTLKFITLVTQTLLLLLTENQGLQQSYNANRRLRSTMKMVILHKIATVCAVTQTTNRFSQSCSFSHFIFSNTGSHSSSNIRTQTFKHFLPACQAAITGVVTETHETFQHSKTNFYQ